MSKEALLEKLIENRYGDSSVIVQLCDELYSLADKDNDTQYMGLALYYKGEALYSIDENQAIDCMSTSLYLMDECVDYELCARANNILGIIANHREDFNAAMNYYLKTIEICKAHGNSHVAGLGASNIGFLFQTLGAYDKAISYYESSSLLFSEGKQEGYEEYIMTVYTNIFNCLFALQDKYRMLDILKKLRECKEIIDPIFALPTFEAIYCSFIGDEENMDEYIKQAVELCIQQEEKPDYIDNYQFLCEFLFRNDRMEELAKVLDVIDRDIPEDIFPRIRMDFVKYSMEYCQRIGDMDKYIQKSKEYVSLYERVTHIYHTTILDSLKLQVYVDQLEQSEDHYKKAASTDKLTKLYNRSGFERVAGQMVEMARDNNELLAFFMIDIDYFKQYNDYYGHVKGDECLMAVASVIQGIENEKAVGGRIGGDEFVIIGRDMSLETAASMAELIVENVRALHIESKESPISDYVSVSVGAIVDIPGPDTELKSLMDSADKKLYESKEKGRNTFSVS